jgi:hypothetical protein
VARHRQPAGTRLGTLLLRPLRSLRLGPLPRRLVLTTVGTAIVVVLAGAVAGTALTATPEAHQAPASAVASTPPASPAPSPTTPGVPTMLAQSGSPDDTEPAPTQPPPTTKRPAPSPSSSPSSTALLPCDNYQDDACMASYWQLPSSY